MNMIVHRVSPWQARYTPMGGREKCARCRFYIAPKWCGHVTGPVSPMGWCKYFSQEMRQRFGGSQVVAIGPPGATLDLGFMTPGIMPAGITFARASTATYTDASGAIQPAAANAPRWDYTGGVLRGLLIEEARTNLLLNSATLGTQSITVTAQAYTLSFYGTGTITKSGAATGALVGTGATQRVTQTFTPTAGTVTCTVTGSVTNAQLEAGAFPTSYIPTTAATVTRAQDSCLISPANTAPWFVSPGGSWMAEFIAAYFVVGGYQRIISIPPGPGNIGPLLSSDANTLGQYDGSLLFFGSALQANVTIRGATTLSGTSGKVCLNGGAVGTGVMSGGYPTITTAGVSFMTTAASPSTENVTGWLRRVQYWPRVLSDAEMQQVTT
jgi:hypothetical protein